MRKLTTYPTVWAVLGTTTIGLSGGLLGNLIYGLQQTHTTRSLLWGGALILMGAGILFYVVYALGEFDLHDTRSFVQRRERDFLWDCTNKPMRDVVSDYINEEHGITEEVLRNCHKERFVNASLIAQFDAAAASRSNTKKLRRQCTVCAMLAMVLILVATAVILVYVAACASTTPLPRVDACQELPPLTPEPSVTQKSAGLSSKQKDRNDAVSTEEVPHSAESPRGHEHISDKGIDHEQH
jgi:hypothetical protein